MISLGSFEKNPAKVFDYYKTAVQDPKGFCRSINYDEDLADSAVVVLIYLFLLMALSSVSMIAQGTFSVSVILMTVPMLALGLGLATLVSFVVGKVAAAKVTFLRAFNVVIHAGILTLPITVLGQWVSLVSLVSTAIGLTFFAYVYVQVFSAIAVRIYVAVVILLFLIVVPLSCLWVGKKVVETNPQLQEILQGRSLEEFAEDMEHDLNASEGGMKKAMQKMQEISDSMEKSKAILPACYNELMERENKNPMFAAVGIQMQALGIAPADKKQELLTSFAKQIDELIAQENRYMPMSEEEKACLRELKAKLSQL